MNGDQAERWGRDRALALRCLAGDGSAWSELVARHAGRIFSHCRLAGLGPEDAEDVTQKVFPSALRSLGTYRGCSLSTWLYRITRRRIADHFRSPQRRLVPVGDREKDPASAAHGPVRRTDPESAASRAEEAERTRSALGRLPEPTRPIMTAYYLYELPVREIAEAADMPVNTVKSHLHRGRRAVRENLEESRDL